MKIDQLHYFVVTAQTQHIGKASRQLNVSPSTISHSIRGLENTLGHRLFEKVGKNIYLTETGKRLAARAAGLLQHLEQIEVEFKSREITLEGQFRLGVTHGLSNLVVAPVLGEFQKNHPQIVFEMYSLRSAQVLEQTARGELDIGICFSPNPHPSIVVHHQIKRPLQISVRRNHPLLMKRGNLSKELSALPAAIPKAFSGIEVCEDHPALTKLHIKAKPAFIFDSYEVASEYLKKTDAWCLMPDSLIMKLNLATLSIKGLEAEASIVVMSPKGRAIPAQLLDQLRSIS